MKVLCLGSFDPVTAGHFDYISRAARLFDKVTVAVAVNSEKKYFFGADDRIRFLEAAFAEFDNVEVCFADDWAADTAKRVGADAILKSARDGEDFSYETDIASVNRAVCGTESLFLPPAPELKSISSSAVRELLRHGKALDGFVPEGAKKLIEKAALSRL